MFRWSVAKSAEAMFSQWAIKRVCKFLLKKKLGKFIVGDIDLDQLDVQLGEGTIQLTDLALNVDYLNSKLDAAPFFVKEGSIGSLLVKIPWKLANCEIEVDGLELVLIPCKRSSSPAEDDHTMRGQDCQQSAVNGVEKVQYETTCGSAVSASLDVHEGVKTIAKMVKWLLTSFHIKVKNLIVAFEPCLERDDEKAKSHRTLVLRVIEIEYGTCVSEDTSTLAVPRVDSFLGMTRLTNFVKFQGAVVELLQMNDVDDQFPLPCTSATTFTDIHTEGTPLGSTTPILTGGTGGFSGTLKLSIPWKNGSLDISKVDADVSIDPIEFRLQPSTIDWIICLWEHLIDAGVEGKREIHHHKTVDSACIYSASYSQSFTRGSNLAATSKVIPSCKKNSHGSCYLSSEALETDASLPGAHVIPDWVPFSINRSQKNGAEGEAEPDYGASLDQFFECFDGMRSSQAAALGNSGIWNWTCSVFSAITAASSLASGSMYISPEQQHVETILRATVLGISVILSFEDEKNWGQSFDATGRNGISEHHVEPKYDSSSDSDVVMSSTCSAIPTFSFMSCEQSTETSSVGENVHYLEAKCKELVLSLQVCHQSIKFEAMIKHIDVDDCFNHGNKAGNFDSYSQMIFDLQEDVQCALPSFPFYSEGTDSDETINGFSSPEIPLCTKSVIGNTKEVGHRIDGDLVKVRLLKSLGVCNCHFEFGSTSMDDKSQASTIFSVDLPPFILWVNFHVVNMLFDLSKRVGSSFTKYNSKKDTVSDIFEQRHDSSCCGESKEGACTYVKNVTPRGSIQGSFFLPYARVILCFPFENHGDLRNFSSWDKFICLDLSPSLSLKEIRDSLLLPSASCADRYSCSPSNSVHLNFGDLNLFLVVSAGGSGGGVNLCTKRRTFCAEKILYATRGTDGRHPVISMSWQGGLVTGPWIASKAWCLVASHESRNRNKMSGEDYEFASVTTMKHLEETISCLRQEMVLSSGFFLHVSLSLVWINIGSFEYELLHCLVTQLVDGFTQVAPVTKASLDDDFDRVRGLVSNDNSSQVSVLIDCDVLNLSIKLEKEAGIKRSEQKELPGCWESLRLTIEKFELLSVSNIGGIGSANFVWASHDEGELWGCFDGCNDDSSKEVQEFLLISCRNSSMQRGDGEGTNALSSGSAGTTILHLGDPHSFRSFTSITVRCGTIVAPGGRLDWVNEICNFFSLPSHENEQMSNSSTQKGFPEDHTSFASSFFLDLVDVALSYEPHVKNSTVVGDSESECSTYAKPVESSDQYVSCLLSASSLNLFNETVTSCAVNEYKIRLHDIGLLVCASYGSENNDGIYGVDYLRRNGYVKVAGETLIEALFRTNCNNGLLWELECSKSHVNLNTCCDTTAGLIRLAAQLQRLFAPDIEESIVHLQNRWNSVHKHDGHGNVIRIESSECSAFPAACGDSLCREVDDRSVVVGLMDEILEDAFYINGDQSSPSSSHAVQSHIAIEGGLPGVVYNMNIDSPTADVTSGNVTFRNSTPGLGFENIHTSSSIERACFSELMEGFYMSELLPQAQPSGNSHSLSGVDLKCKSATRVDTGNGNSRWYKDSSLRIIEDHVSKEGDGSAGRWMYEASKLPSVNSMAPDESCKPCGRVLLKNIGVTWRMYGGVDWPNLGENVLHTLNMGGRDSSVCLELALMGMNMQYDMFPNGEIYVSRLSLSVQDFHVYDNSRNAPWKKVLGYYESKNHPRESGAKAFKLDLEAVRPDPLTPLEEYRLRLAFLPMRLHLDQSQLDFLINFFACKGSSIDHSPDIYNDLNGSRMQSEKSHSFAGQKIAEEALLPFFQKFDIWPVIVSVDYNPRHIDLKALRGGSYAELLNLVPWKGIELDLKHVHAIGVYGWSNVGETILGEWLEDISHNQVHKLLQGLPPIRSLVAVGSGAAKLVSLPVKNYKKDHRLLKGMQRGAIAFLRSVSLEAVALGVHLAAGAHDILLQTEYVLASIPPSVPVSLRSRERANVRSNQPKDVQQGIQQAYESISDGLGKTASALVGNPIKTYQRGAGVGSALVAAVRAAPAAAVAPASATARAVHWALLGVRNSLDPEHKKESMEKYLGSSQARDHRK